MPLMWDKTPSVFFVNCYNLDFVSANRVDHRQAWVVASASRSNTDAKGAVAVGMAKLTAVLLALSVAAGTAVPGDNTTRDHRPGAGGADPAQLPGQH